MLLVHVALITASCRNRCLSSEPCPNWPRRHGFTSLTIPLKFQFPYAISPSHTVPQQRTKGHASWNHDGDPKGARSHSKPSKYQILTSIINTNWL